MLKIDRNMSEIDALLFLTVRHLRRRIMCSLLEMANRAKMLGMLSTCSNHIDTWSIRSKVE